MVAKSKAIVEVVLDDKDFKRKSGQATAGLESEMKKVGGAIMGVVAALGVVAAAKGAVDMLTTLTKKAIEVADSFEIMEKQLTTLTKSEGKAKAFFAAIKQFAMDTPYQVRDLAQSFNMLYPVFKDKTVPMLKLIGDTAAGTGRSFQDTGSAMMRMATGDWGIEIMRQLFLVKSEFGDIFGPNGELVGTQEEAWAKLEEILGDRFGGMMVGMMDTVQGKVSNLKDVLDSLGAAVGAELTPVTKEFLDLLIEVVKQAEESGELQDMARDIADTFRDNKDVLVEIVGLIPEMISLLAATGHAVADIVSKIAELNEAWGDWTGSGKTALAELDELLGILGGTLNMVGEVIRGSSWSRAREVGRSRQAGIGKEYREGESLIKTRPAGMRGFAEVGEAPSDVEALVREMKEQGYSPEDILFQARGTRAESRVEAILAPELPRGAAKKPGKAPKKGKEYLGPKGPSYELEVYEKQAESRAKMDMAEDERDAEREAKRAAELKKQEEEIKTLAETYAEYLDPTSYIIAGLKSGEMGAAIQDFATSLGEKVAAELVHKLIVMGIMAILNIATGGATTPMQMAMARGGVIKAQGGLTMLPARPGGWTFPWAGKWINAAEGGRPEVLGIFPEGQRGRDLIMRELLPQFFPETQMVNRNTFSPNIDVTLRGTDPQSIGVAVRAEQGSVNRDHVQRRAA